MTVTLDLPAELAHALQRRAAAQGQDLAAYLQDVAAQNLAEEPVVRPTKRSVEDFKRRLKTWIARHPVLDHSIDDSRESIYAGRGE